MQLSSKLRGLVSNCPESERMVLKIYDELRKEGIDQINEDGLRVLIDKKGIYRSYKRGSSWGDQICGFS